MNYSQTPVEGPGWHWLFQRKVFLFPRAGICLLVSRITCINIILSILAALIAFRLCAPGSKWLFQITAITFIAVEYFVLPVFWLVIAYLCSKPEDPTEW